MKKTIEIDTRFYHYHQNNSGGVFHYDHDRGLSENVIVEAQSAAEADDRAERIGLYFDGSGDCDCCGSRWSSMDNGWSQEGDDVPKIYGDTAPWMYTGGWTEENHTYVHYYDDHFVGYNNASRGEAIKAAGR